MILKRKQLYLYAGPVGPLPAQPLFQTHEAVVRTDDDVIDQLNIVVTDMAASVAFYRRLGITIPEGDPRWSSHHVNAELFQDTVLSAAYDARKILRRVAIYSQSPDHPIIPMIPETEYLKGFGFELVR